MGERARIAVIGGGVAGCAAALALHRARIDGVVLLEAEATPGPRVGETIPPQTRRLLAQLGVGASFDAEPHAACWGSASCWGTDELGFNDHLVHTLGHGWHLDRARFDAWLGQQATRAGVDRRTGWAVASVERDDEGWRVRSPGHAELRAGLVIDATGRAARIARRLGARRLDHDRLIYLACTIEATRDTARSGQTWLEATADGWWYAAQLPGGEWTVAIATDPEIVRARRLTRCDGWLAALRDTAHLSRRVPDTRVHEEHPVAWVASSSLLAPPAGPGWLAVGDAAATYDPICARGIYKALEDGLRAAEAIAGHLRGDRAALASLAGRTVAAFRAYLQQRTSLYEQEQRFVGEPFWARRHQRRNLVDPRAGRRPTAGSPP